MAYDPSILAEGLELYIAGNSAAKIAAELKRRHPDKCARLCEKSVLKWITKPDAFKKTWLDKKAETCRKADEKIVDKSADRRAQMLGVLDEMIDDLTKGVKSSPLLGAENPLWGLTILTQMIRQRLDLMKDVPVDATISARHIQILFETIQADADLGPVWERRREELLRTYQEKCRAAGLEK